VDLEAWGDRASEERDRWVLYDQGVDPCLCDLDEELREGLELILKEEGVEGEVGARAGLMTALNDPFELMCGDALGLGAGVEPLAEPKIDRVRPC
jgi:hypothetical protein